MAPALHIDHEQRLAAAGCRSVSVLVGTGLMGSAPGHLTQAVAAALCGLLALAATPRHLVTVRIKP